MLAIVTPDHLDEVLGLCERWEIRASVIGRVTDTARFRVYDGLFDAVGVPGANPRPPRGDAPPEVSSDLEPVADVPIGSLGDGPVYRRPFHPPASLGTTQGDDPVAELRRRFPRGADLSDQVLELLSRPNIADKSWVWRQYDHQLFLNTVVGPGGDATVLRIKESPGRGLAMSVDGKARHCALDPRTGGRLVVLEAARNVACTGARPLALVNCLNFGNPEHPEVMWQFVEAVEGMREACEALGIPVIGGNVSFYNESRGADIDPTPVVGVVGVVDELHDVPPRAAFNAGDRIVVLGATKPELGGSEWATMHGLLGGRPPAADLDAARKLHDVVAQLVRDRCIAGLHDASDGGLVACLSEMAIAGQVGFRASVGDGCAWFSESASRVVLAVAPDRLDEVVRRCSGAGIPVLVAGTAGGDRLVGEGVFDVGLAEATTAWRDSIPALLGATVPISE
jgi:phosphoribosylformylglycinamidine synthase